ncbi:MAG: acylphosphatase [Flavisolibacter sp.]
MPAVHLIIKGKVQGVFFRASTKDKADSLGIKGWVKNTPDGDVEVKANGDPLALEEFIEWCKIGPSKATVTGVEKMIVEEEIFSGFRIAR